MANKTEPLKYKTESLLKSKEFANYQRDFAKALLYKPEYSVEEAKKILNNFYEKKEEK